MDSGGVILVVALCAAGGLLWLWRRGSRARHARFFKAEGMPAELAEGRLLMSEVDITCDHPIALAGRPDQVYLLPTEQDAIAVYDRYLRIVEGRTPARRHGRGSPFCRRCAYRAVCR